MRLDRALQLKILEFLAESYPNKVESYASTNFINEVGDWRRLETNLAYLGEHGLIESGLMPMGHVNGHHQTLRSARITHRGLDFLEKDGGLSAIFDTVTIKFHEDLLRDLIEQGLLQASFPQEEKTGVLQKLRELPADSIKHLTMKLLDLGLENVPAAVALIRTSLP